MNSENLNPGNALWDKYTSLFSNIDTEPERFIDFERWWNGFYFLSREEIAAIVENLFIGNQLERGPFRICDGCVADLTRIRNPHVGHLGIFVSASVARLEHRAILESLAEIEALEPGLYEMKIDNPTGDPDCHRPQSGRRSEPRACRASGREFFRRHGVATKSSLRLGRRIG